MLFLRYMVLVKRFSDSSNPAAIYAVNTSRTCTGTADSRVFPAYTIGHLITLVTGYYFIQCPALLVTRYSSRIGFN